MTAAFRLYRGLEVYPLVFPHRATEPGSGRNYDQGFDAAVRIQDPGASGASPRCRVFKLAVNKPFENTGDARRASTAYAEHLIDRCSEDTDILALEV
ncbi:hypothetical protein [Trinickia sp.]|uniref:hypothetical protein n=1 Tax=Trinickia sp. TaxID=2571163 RepID=UPI003F7FD710